MTLLIVSTLAVYVALAAGITVSKEVQTLRAVGPRRVRWYVNVWNIADNVQFVKEYSDSLTGVYGCCDVIKIADDGSVSTKLDIGWYSRPITQLGVTYHVMATPSMDAILSGNASKAASDIVDLVLDAGITGVIFDYEPTSDYGFEHENAYMSFLRAVKEAANGTSVEVGMDIASWGILKDLTAYVPAQLDLYTSMYPTYYMDSALNVLGRGFVSQMIETFGAEHVAAGVGSVPVGRYKANCSNYFKFYEWSPDGLENFTRISTVEGLLEIDVWRCDINSYGTTPRWFFDALRDFLQQPNSSSELLVGRSLL